MSWHSPSRLDKKWVTSAMSWRPRRRAASLSSLTSVSSRPPSPLEPPGRPVDEPVPEDEATVETLRRLAELARDAVRQMIACLDAFHGLHLNLVSGFETFLGKDPEGLDAPSVDLAKACFAFFDQAKHLLEAATLKEVSSSCDQVVDECAQLQGMIRNRNDATHKVVYYEAKIQRLKQQENAKAAKHTSEGPKLLHPRSSAHRRFEDSDSGDEKPSSTGRPPSGSTPSAGSPDWRSPEGTSPDGPSPEDPSPDGPSPSNSPRETAADVANKTVGGSAASSASRSWVGPSLRYRRASDRSTFDRRHLRPSFSALNLASIWDPSRGRLPRNLRKLAKARIDCAEIEETCGSELLAFGGRRTMQTRAVFHALLKTYVRLIADWGRKALPVADAFDEEVQPGTVVSLVGLGGNAPFCGGVLQSIDEETGRMVVSLPGGHTGAVRPEQCLPDRRAGVRKAALSGMSLSPSFGPCFSSFEAEIRCTGLDGPIEEVIIGGVPAEILSATSRSARVRVPYRESDGMVAVEVRAANWRQRVASADSAFWYFRPLAFGQCGRNVRLSSSDGSTDPNTPMPVAKRHVGLLDASVLTLEPLDLSPLPRLAASPSANSPTGGSPRSCKTLPSRSESPIRSSELRPPPALNTATPRSLAGARDSEDLLVPTDYCHYFEIQIQELAQRTKGTTRTLSLGFAWLPRQPRLKDFNVTSGQSSQTRVGLPEMLHMLEHTFIIGGDLPRAYLGGKEVKKITGWRPLLDLQPNAIVGAMLQRLQTDKTTSTSTTAAHRLTIFQDGLPRCSVEVGVPRQWCAVFAVHGAVDICGSVVAVELRQAAAPAHPGSGGGDSAVQAAW